MISNIRLSGVAVTSMPLSFRAGYVLSAVPARADVVAAARAGSAAAARVGAVAVAAAQRHLPVANAEWLTVAGIARQPKRRTPATTRASVDWSPT